jgi:hypothetical protein
VYELEEGKFIDTLESSITTEYNWEKIFLCLGQQYADHKNMPATLWCALFALMIMFNDEEHGCILIHSCYAEMKEGGDTQENQFCLKLLSPQSMAVLKMVPHPFVDNPDTLYTVPPVYVYDHNPHLLCTNESVYPLFYAKKSELTADLHKAARVQP